MGTALENPQKGGGDADFQVPTKAKTRTIFFNKNHHTTNTHNTRGDHPTTTSSEILQRYGHTTKHQKNTAMGASGSAFRAVCEEE